MTVVDTLYVGKFLNQTLAASLLKVAHGYHTGCLYEKLIGCKSLAKNTGVENKKPLQPFSQFCIITIANLMTEYFQVRI